MRGEFYVLLRISLNVGNIEKGIFCGYAVKMKLAKEWNIQTSSPFNLILFCPKSYFLICLCLFSNHIILWKIIILFILYQRVKTSVATANKQK